MLSAAIDPGQIVTTATSGLGDALTSVATPALAVGVGLFGITKGWSLVKRFVN